MENTNLKKQNRMWIALNYLSLIAVLVFFYTGKYFHWPLFLAIFTIVSLGIFFISFLKAFIKTNFWKMVHTSNKNLDERETQIVLNALKYSYSIFTVICLIIIYFFAVAKPGFIDVILAGGLLYLAHTLPPAIVGWNEKYIKE